jgi:hypothetical protein
MQLLFKSRKAINSQGSSPSLPVLAPYLACLTPIPYLPYSHTLPALFPYLFCLTPISFLPYSHTLPALLPCLACHTPLPCLFYLVSSLLTPMVSSLLSPVVGGSPSSTLTIDRPPAYPPPPCWGRGRYTRHSMVTLPGPLPFASPTCGVAGEPAVPAGS